ncbi:MAG: hypothetical protein M0Z47_04100 [Actinomycetota bacterium]|nr:hypothetical protein [Actinomycetota bacterium]
MEGVEVERNRTYRKRALQLRATQDELLRLQKLLHGSVVRDTIPRAEVAEWIDRLAELAAVEGEE